MSSKIILIITLYLITFSFEGPCIITDDPHGYTDCRNKPADLGSYCCFLEQKNGKKYCVELTKAEVDDDKIKDTWKVIESGNYNGWENKTGLSESKLANFTKDDLEELRCNGSDSLYFKKLGIIAILLALLL